MSIASAAQRVAGLLKAAERKVVFAESCTGGLVSGALTRVPGISNYHCGGVVAYRDATKVAYLGIPRAMIDRFGAVSGRIAEQMALEVLKKTPEADVAASVTGHMGPKAPPKLDGVVFVAIAWRASGRDKITNVLVRQLRCRRDDSRVARQRWVVEQVLRLLGDKLEGSERR